MTREEYFAKPLVVRLGQAYYLMVEPEAERLPEDDKNNTDPLVFVDDGIGIHVSDVISDTIFFLKQLQSRNFGVLTEMHDGVKMGCSAVVPGLSIRDLTLIFEEAAKTGNDLSGNPGNWREVKGINAVLDAVFKALANR